MTAQPPARPDEPEADKAFNMILEEIVSGAIGPGAKLNETELSRRFGINRNALREAIRRLQGRRLVHYTPNVGARVVAHTARNVADAYEVREVLEGMAARLAAERMPDDDVTGLLAVARRDMRTDTAPTEPGNMEFHRRIVRGCGNETVERVLDEDFFQLLRFWTLAFPWLQHRDDRSEWDHVRIAEAIAFRDGDAAEVLMRGHIRRLREAMRARLEASRS